MWRQLARDATAAALAGLLLAGGVRLGEALSARQYEARVWDLRASVDSLAALVTTRQRVCWTVPSDTLHHRRHGP